MLEDAAGIRRIVLACGYVDLRKGIDGLSMIIEDKYHQNPFEKGIKPYLLPGGEKRMDFIYRYDQTPAVEALPMVRCDYFGHPRDERKVIPGPFGALCEETEIG